MKRALIAAVTLAVSCGALWAAPSPSVGETSGDPQVSRILERFPARDAAARDGLCAEILALGPGAIGDVCARVLPSGEGDDSQARYAVNALADCAGRPGAEEERALFAGALLDSLEETRDETVAAFFLSQVRLVGKQESIGPLERYLVDERLAGPAAAALLSIGGPEAAAALRGALDQAPRDAQVVLLQSLGEARSPEAVPKILPFAESGDEGIRQAALYALANIGDPAAGPVLSRSRVASPLRERRQMPSLYLLYARRLLESGRTEEGLEASRAVLESYDRAEESQHASEALALVVSALGERALPDLLAAADSPDGRFRGSALALAAAIPGEDATLAWVDEARTSPSDVQADILAMLGERGDAAALPFVRESLTSGDEAVRLAAIPAATRLGGEGVLPDLLPLLGAAGEAESAVLKTALLGYPGALVVPEAVRLLDATPLPGRVVLIDVLGEKGARDQTQRLFGLCEDPEPAVRTASIAALGRLAGDADLPRLVAMAEAGKGSDRAHLQEAVISVVLRNPDPERRADGLLELLNDSAPAGKVAILGILTRVGGTKPLQAVVAEIGNPDPAVQAAAVKALSGWPEESAADDLARLASTTRDPKYFRSAVEGYVRLLRRSRRSTAEKLSVLEGLLARPEEEADRKVVLAGIAGVREPESLRLLAGYLDDPALQDAAAASILDLASRQSGREPWLSGHEAYSVLRRVEATLADTSDRERAATIVLERLRQGGFVPLFDGESLDGWKGLVADPPARAKMSAEELARAQAEADEKMRAHWSVVDGVLVFDGGGTSLCTSSDYADFELLVDWKIEKDGDSGLYLRGSPQVQIWDGEANPAGSGGLFNNEKGPSEPRENADRPVGEWNTFRIIMMGERVTVYLNDKQVVRHAVLENYWEREKPIYPTGQIELQAHGNPLQFRNVFVREIPADPAPTGMSAAEAGEGFRWLFNGRDLEGWTGNLAAYPAEDGKIVVRPQRGGGGNLYTAKEYADFVLRFDFKLTPAANNGLGIRAPLEGDAAYVGMELQVLEDGSPVYWGLQPYQYHGSIYGAVPARRGVLRPVGEWNTEEVTVEGRRVEIVVNGTTVVDADLDAASAGGTMDGKEHPGLTRESGHIGFLGHGSIVEFRNIRLKELP